MLFARDLRVHDNPALDAAVRRAEGVVPLFVLEDRLVSGPLAAPNRVRFLLEAVGDLRSSLRKRGGDLVIRRGDTVGEAIGLARDTGAEGAFCAGDVSGYAAGRQRRLTAACQQARLELVLSPGVTVVPPAELRPSGGGDHYRVFTPYLRAWERAKRLAAAAARWSNGAPAGRPETGRAARPRRPAQGCREVSRRGIGRNQAARCLAALRRVRRLRRRPQRPGRRRDLAAVPAPATSAACHRFSWPRRPGDGWFGRQLAWRDFFHQVTAAFPAITTRDYRPGQCAGATTARRSTPGGRPDRCRSWTRACASCCRKAGCTTGPDDRCVAAVQAAAHRLAPRRAALHGPARRRGHRQQLTATGSGPRTGNDTRPGRVLSPLRQATRFDAAATTSGATCRSSLAWTPWRSAGRGRCPRASAVDTRRRSSRSSRASGSGPPGRRARSRWRPG